MGKSFEITRNLPKHVEHPAHTNNRGGGVGVEEASQLAYEAPIAHRRSMEASGTTEIVFHSAHPADHHSNETKVAEQRSTVKGVSSEISYREGNALRWP